jgi:hypothetical protein
MAGSYLLYLSLPDPECLDILTGYAMFLGTDTTQPMVRYAATFLIAIGAFQFGALSNAQISANVLSDTSRSSAIGLNVMAGKPK